MSHSATTLWRTLRLGGFGRIVTGRTPPTGQDDLFGSQYPFITPTDMDYGVRRATPQRFISPEGAAYLQRIMLPPRTPAFVCIGATIGKVCLTDTASFTNQQLNSIIVDQDAHDPIFVYYLLVMAAEGIKKLAGGAATPIINKSSFSEVEVVVPPLPTQRRIASVLSAYDDLIENNTRRIAILEEMARRLYEEWFVQFRFPGHEEAEFEGELPEGWEMKRLDTVATVNPESISPRQAPDTINYIDIASVSPGRVDAVQAMSFEEAPGRARRIVRSGDVIWSCVRPNRRSHALILAPAPDTIASTGFAVLRAKLVPFSYLYQTVTTNTFVDYLVNHATGAAYPAVKQSDFEAAVILVPARPVLDLFEQAVGPMLRLIHALDAKNANLRAQRDLLLPKLISGEIDVSNLPLPGTDEQAA